MDELKRENLMAYPTEEDKKIIKNINTLADDLSPTGMGDLIFMLMSSLLITYIPKNTREAVLAAFKDQVLLDVKGIESKINMDMETKQ